MKEIGVISWKLPPREMSCQHFCEIFPSKNNHDYSTVMSTHKVSCDYSKGLVYVSGIRILASFYGDAIMITNLIYIILHYCRDALLVSIINCGTSVFAGFAVFSLLGHMSFVTNRPVKEVADSGPGLSFVAYPEGIAKLGDWAPIVAFLFFFMIFTLGLDSQVGIKVLLEEECLEY